MTLTVQVMTMIAMTLGGIYLGFALETHRRLTRRLQHRSILLYVLESLFWTSQTAILFFVLYKVNYGELRFYVFLACLFGFSVYQVLCKRIYQKVLEGVISAAKTIVGWIFQALNALLVQPILWLFHLLLKILRLIWNPCRKLLLYTWNLLIFIGKKVLPENFYKFISNFYAFCSTMVDKLTKMIRSIMKKWR